MSKISVFNTVKESYDRTSGARVLLFIMKLFGIWQWSETSNNDTIILSLLLKIHRYAIHLPGSFTFCFLMLIEVINSPDMVQAGNVLYMFLALVIYNIKLVNIWSLQRNAFKFINDLQCNPVYELNTTEERNMWTGEQKKFHILVLFFLIVSVFSGIFEFVSVLFADKYELAYPYYVPFEWHNQHNYWYAYAYNIVGITVCCFSNVSLDMFGCYVIFYIGLLYKLLSLRIEDIQSVGETVALEKLIHCLQMHRNIRRITKECETIVSVFVLCQILFSALIICFSGYRLQRLNIMENWGQFFSMVQFMSIMILEIYLPCYFANQITVNSSKLTFNLYSMKWFEFSIAKRKFLILCMEFFKHSERLKAGNFFIVGLPIFTRVMNNAYTFFALLLKLAAK